MKPCNCVADMVCQQRCQLTIKPEYGYKHKDCHMKPPEGAPADEPLHFDIKLLELYSKDDVRVVGTNENIYKTIKERSESWETPREPYEVSSHTNSKVDLSGGASFLWGSYHHALVFVKLKSGNMSHESSCMRRKKSGRKRRKCSLS